MSLDDLLTDATMLVVDIACSTAAGAFVAGVVLDLAHRVRL